MFWFKDKTKIFVNYFLGAVFSLFPLVGFAQGPGINGLLLSFQNFLKLFPPILISLAFVVFVWGIIRYILADGEKAQKEAVGILTFSIIAMTVLVGLWGIVYFLQNNFGISGDPNLPDNKLPILNLNTIQQYEI